MYAFPDKSVIIMLYGVQQLEEDPLRVKEGGTARTTSRPFWKRGFLNLRRELDAGRNNWCYGLYGK